MFISATRLDNVPVSASAALTAMARDIRQQGANVIPLSLGEPDFDTPAHVVEAAHAAALRGDTRYPPQPGTPELKAAIRRKFQRDNQLDYALDEIMVANGGTQIVFDAFMASIDPGDEVIVPAPYWISYTNIVRFAGGTPVAVDCPESNGFKLRLDDLEAAITPRTKWLVLNFPNNPTGAVCSRDEMKGIAELLLRHPHVLVLTDDMYEHIIYDGAKFCTLVEVEPALCERVLTVNGVSKTYAMTGWRVGFCAGPKPLLQAMLNVQGQATNGICTVAQAAAVAALDGPQDLLRERCESYRVRRDLVMNLLADAPGLRYRKPGGAFYIFPSMAAHIGKRTKGGTLIRDDKDFVLALLQEKHVATVYGAAYGMGGYFRISYAADVALLTEACRRIVEFCGELR
ncbi:pyridoxal phosphate-dependent aminotransferase [Paraburkholderia sp.]|uniref:pyridoxal phosphate-dependent aminotransferase n=1 Tax=Paraburkholderia sp. TaxID=1926495 RepID=UPI0039E5AE5C